MIFNNSTQYAKIWKVTRPKDENGNPRKYIDLQVSTYEKNQDDEYVYSSWFPRVIGHAYNSLKDLTEGEYEKPISLKITKSKFTNEKYTDKEGNKKSAFRFIILEASLDDGNSNANTTQTTSTPAQAPVPAQTNTTTDEDDPW